MRDPVIEAYAPKSTFIEDSSVFVQPCSVHVESMMMSVKWFTNRTMQVRMRMSEKEVPVSARIPRLSLIHI